MKKIVVIAVHPDDETLGAAGTLLRHVDNGDEVHWIIVTEMKTEDNFSKEQIDKRKKEIEKVALMYQFKKVHQLHFSPTKMDTLAKSDIINSISGIFKEIKPEVIYLPFSNDVHSDHHVVFNCAYSCTKNFRYPSIEKILMMEVLSETEYAPVNGPVFIPNYFINIDKYIDKKLEIMQIFENELGTFPFPRSIEAIKAQATLRGAAASCKNAESFMLLKEIVK